MKTKVTIKDVAKYADVGVGTVSRVINNHKGVKPWNREKVIKAIRELGYKPHSIARSLRTNQSKSIVFFVTDISNVAFSTIAKGLHDVLEEHEYNLILYNIGRKNIEEKLNSFFSTRVVDGAILSIEEEESRVIRKLLNELSIPLIVLDRQLEGVRADFIYTDYYNGIKQAVEHLINFNHHKIGFATGSMAIRPSRESLNGYLDALKLNDISVDQQLIRTGNFTKEFGRESMEYFLDKLKQKDMTALVAGSYPILVGFLETIQKRNIRIPEDISLIAFEDSDITRLTNPGITVIRRPLHDMGKKVAYFLLDRLSNFNKENFEASSMIVPTELVLRSSTRKI